MIKANKTVIPASSTIHPSVEIRCNTFEIGENCYIGPNCIIMCNHFKAGDYFYMPGSAEIGRGGCNGPDSNVTIGKGVGIFEGCVLNPSESLSIGDYVGIGADCLLWTHGAWLSVLDGFPADFACVAIGNNVWLPARSVVLPGVSIGNDCVIGTGSVVTHDIPSGSLAMGSPCKVVKADYYPKNLTDERKLEIVQGLVHYWQYSLLPHKGIASNCIFVAYTLDGNVVLNHRSSDQSTTININDKTISGYVDDIVEDLRDFLRRRGIKIYTGAPFKSIPANYETTWA
mgnify:CR=1 FL=1